VLSSPASIRAGYRAVPLLAVLALLAGTAPAGAGVGDAVPAAAAPDPLADDDENLPGFADPMERMNRATFRLNLSLDRWCIDPIARGYAFVVPQPARHAVRRVLANLNSPAILVNDVLQLKPLDAGITVTRFVLNTTVGLLGIFDPAKPLGLEPHEADFGETLALAGVPSGPFLMLPIAGPATARDATGYLVDFLFRPTTYILTPGAQIVFTSVTESSAGIAARDVHAEGLRVLEESSVDYYAALRNAFYQDRTARIAARRERPGPAAVAARALGALTFSSARSEVGDLPAERDQERVETLALEY
jgi:phospholipid-binding lipoprotein MlaA